MLRELTQMADDGDLVALTFMGETPGRQQIDGLCGRYRQDPSRVIGHLAVLKQKLTALAIKSSDRVRSRP